MEKINCSSPEDNKSTDHVIKNDKYNALQQPLKESTNSQNTSISMNSISKDEARRAKKLKQLKSNLFEDTTYGMDHDEISGFSDIPDEVLQWSQRQCMYDRLKNRSGSRRRSSGSSPKIEV